MVTILIPQLKLIWPFNMKKKSKIGFYPCLVYKGWVPIELNYPFLSVGMEIEVSTLISGRISMKVTKIDVDSGEARNGDLAVWLKRENGRWHYSSTSYNAKAIAKIKIV